MDSYSQVRVTVCPFFAVVESLKLCLTPTSGTAARQALSSTVSRSLLRFVSVESVTLSSHLLLCQPLLPLPSVFARIWVLSNELALHVRWPEPCSFSSNPFREYSGLISSDLSAAQGTLKSLIQHHRFLKASVLRCSAFLMVHYHICMWLLKKP